MTVRADLDTIREALEALMWPDGYDQALAALDRLAGCVILTREEAEELRNASPHAQVRAFLDARLGAAAEETKDSHAGMERG